MSLLHCTFAPTGGRDGPNPSSSSSLSDSSDGFDGSLGLSSSGAGGIAGPITRLRFSPAEGLGERFAPEVAVSSSSACSSCFRFRLASKYGGNSGPIPDIVLMGGGLEYGKVVTDLQKLEACTRGGGAESFRGGAKPLHLYHGCLYIFI